MQIHFPRRIQLGFRPWYGLTLRQLGYLVAAGVIAGGIILFGPVEKDGLLIRALIGLGIIGVGVALAFFRSSGMTVEQWIVARIRFSLHPQKRVWTRGGGGASEEIAEILIDQSNAGEGVATDDEEGALFSTHLLRPNPPSSALSAAVVLVDMAMLLSLFTFAVYLSRGGLNEIQGWVSMQFGR